MAYIIFNNRGELLNIAANDTELGWWVFADNCTVKDVSQSDFDNVRFNLMTCSLDGDTINYESKLGIDTDGTPFTTYIWTDAAELQSHLDLLKNKLQESIDNGHTQYQDYLNYLESFDVSSLTYPLNQSWEQWCNDNGVNFYNTLQIV
tara:strand:+ start:411 stop:854 length:444 start_codon:yes stop_codon:yes gene_type:complete